MTATTSHTGPSLGGPVAVLDMGATRITCVIAQVQGDDGLAVMGMGRRPTLGLRGTMIADIPAAAAAIRAAVGDAERAAGAAVNAVTVSFGGEGLASLTLRGETALGAKPVATRDQRRALDAALRHAETPGRVVLHALPTAWRVDDEPTGDPRGRPGARLALSLHVVSARAAPVRTLMLAVTRAGLEVRALTAAPYAAGLACLSREEAQAGALVVDCGAASGVAGVFQGGRLTHVAAAPIGAGHVTRDLAIGLGAPLDVAEEVKRAHGDVSTRALHDRAFITLPPSGSDGRGARPTRIARAELAHFMRPRVEEIFEMLADRLTAAPGYGAVRRVVLTGGGALLAGVAEVATTVFGREARVGAPMRVAGLAREWSAGAADRALGAPAASLCVAAGLARHALGWDADARRGPPRPAPLLAREAAARSLAGGGRWSGAARWLRDQF